MHLFVVVMKHLVYHVLQVAIVVVRVLVLFLVVVLQGFIVQLVRLLVHQLLLIVQQGIIAQSAVVSRCDACLVTTLQHLGVHLV